MPKKIKKANALTDFQWRVLRQTCEIPLGQVRTYKWVAKKIGAPNAYRAVGSVLKKNPYPLIIPCHRVVKSNGDMGGFSRGKSVKRKLLMLEKALRDSFLH